MGRYLRRRFLHSVATLVIVVVAVFFRGSPIGQPWALMLEPGHTQSQYDAITERLGYDRPLLVQFGDYIGGVVQGDLGESIRQNRPALDLVLERLPKTFYLGGLAFALSLIGIPFGVWAGRSPQSIADKIVSSSSFAAMSAPNFWIALVGIQLLAVQFGLLPTSGFGGYSPAGLRYLVLPAFVLALNSTARFAQFSRTAVVEEYAQQYVQAARAKGIPERMVRRVHVMKNAGIGIATLAGDELSSIVNGSVIVETVFGIAGVGALLVSAVEGRDLPLVVATVIVVLVIVMVINLAVDMLYAFLDPRIGYE